VTLLLGALLLALIAAGFVAFPLMTQRRSLLSDVVPGHVLDREARKRVALAALKEVEYDRASGKLDDTDYLEMRTRLEREALAAIDADEAATKVSLEPVRHSCGFTSPVGSRFCAGCGKPLS
jgi:cytochrome c-type biogenesis protein CcmI